MAGMAGGLVVEADRKKELERFDENSVITEQEWDDGWHFCCEWDSMLICQKDKSSEECSCDLSVYPPNAEV